MGCEKVGFINLEKRDVKNEKNETLLEEMHTKAEAVILKNKINAEEFRDLYGDVVDKDIAKAEKLKEKFGSGLDKNSRECKKYAEIMEAIFVDLVDKAEWMGKGTKAMNTADYDDFENGIDAIAEMTQEGGFKKHLGLAMDATFANNLNGKFNGIKGEIVRGEMAKVKYFKSGNFKGQLSEVPHVIIGVSLGTIKELGEMWVKGDTEGLKNHPVQYQVLEEIIIQLETFEKYAEKYDKPELAQVYRDNHTTLREIKAEKEKIQADSGWRDRSFYNIKDEMDKFLEV